MKLILLIVVLACLSCSSEPRTPLACQRNLQWCSAAYKDNMDSFSYEKWNQLCVEDFKTCKSGWGMQ